MTMQGALTALNPAITVGEQIGEVLEAHDETLPPGRAARSRAIREQSVEMLRLVSIPSPEARLKQYPHEFSGGMRQRIHVVPAVGHAMMIEDPVATASVLGRLL